MAGLLISHKQNTTDFVFKNDTIRSFTYYENGDITYSPHNTICSSEKLLPGFYNVMYDDYNDKYFITRAEVNSIKPFNFDKKEIIDKYVDTLLSENHQNTLKELNILNKGGILLYGKEGTGKSTICKYYADKYIKENNAIVIYAQSDHFGMCWNFIKTLRNVHPDSFFIVILEELDNYLKVSGGEEVLKKILDGNLSINNVLLFATTNYIEDIPNAIINRPSRFKYVLEIGVIKSEEDVLEIATNILKHIPYDKDKLLKDCINQTLDYIQQYCLNILFNLENLKVNNKKISF